MSIEAKNIYKTFGNTRVLRGINLKVNDGEVVVMVGASGSGKSTFLRCLNLLAAPTSGNILIDGVDITNPSVDLNQIRRKVGMVFQSFNLFENMSVIDNIKLAPKKLLHKKDAVIEKEARQLLKRVGLLDKANTMPNISLAAKNSALPSLELLPCIQKLYCLMNRPLPLIQK